MQAIRRTPCRICYRLVFKIRRKIDRQLHPIVDCFCKAVFHVYGKSHFKCRSLGIIPKTKRFTLRLPEKVQRNLNKMSSVNDLTALAALKCELLHKSRFREDLTIAPPATIQDALHRGSNWAKSEEEQVFLAERYKTTKKTSGGTSQSTKPKSKESRDTTNYSGGLHT